MSETTDKLDVARLQPLTVGRPDAAKLIGISEATLDRWTKTRGIPHFKDGRVVRFPVRALTDWVNERATRTVTAS